MAIQPPYPTIYTQLMKGQVIPFLGAGVPLYDRNPTTTDWKTADVPPVTKSLPNAGELAADLHRLSGLPAAEKGELTRMAQYYQSVNGSELLRDRLQEVFSFEQDPTPVHQFLAGIAAPLLIVTTNYDDLMERALEQVPAKKDTYHVIVHNTDEGDKVLWFKPGAVNPEEVDGTQLDMKAPLPTIVYKIHGSIDRRDNQRGRYVITEDDYIDFLGRMHRSRGVPSALNEPLSTRPFLFLGYGLYDWNVRLLLASLRSLRRRSSIKSWAIETLPKEVEQKLWSERGVVMFDGLTLKDFLTNLRAQGGTAGGVP